MICTTDVPRGRNLVGKEKLPFSYGVDTSNIDCSIGDMTCKGGHAYNRKKSLKENIRGEFRGCIRMRYASDNKTSIKNIHGEGCVNNDLSYNDYNDVSGPNRNKKNKSYVFNKNGYPNTYILYIS